MQDKFKILVTGSAGFLGGHTYRYMKEQGHTVTGIDKDRDIFKYELPDQRFDVLIHFAAYVGGRKGIDNNLYKITKNIELDRQVIQWAETHVDRMIYPSSCAAYPKALQTQPGTPMHEDMMGGETFDMYGMSKLATECMLKFATVKSHIMRPFTVYGPGQSMDYPLPAIIHRAKQGECSVWGSGTQVHGDYSLNLKTQSNELEGAGYRYADITLLKSLGLEPKISFAEGVRSML